MTNQRNDRLLLLPGQHGQKTPLTCRFGARGGMIIGMIKRIRQKAGWQGKPPGAIAVGEVGQASA
jgi:hypothetical protein